MYYGKLPQTSQAFYYGECMKWFAEIPILDAYKLAVAQLKKRNKVTRELVGGFLRY